MENKQATAGELLHAFPDERESISGITKCQIMDYAASGSHDVRGLYFNPKANRYYFELRHLVSLMD